MSGNMQAIQHRVQSYTPFFIENILNDCIRFRQSSSEYSDSINSDNELAVVLPKIEPLNLCKSGEKRRFEEENLINRKKKLRTTFTGRQIYELEKMFENKKYLNSRERTELSRYLRNIRQLNMCM